MRNPGRTLAGAVACVLALATAGCGDDDATPSPPTVTATPGDAAPPPDSATPPTTASGEPAGQTRPRIVATVATGLAVPWGIGFLPDGSAVVTERDTKRVLHVTTAGDGYRVTPVGVLDAAAPEGEGGLLGIAVSPSYDEDSLVYFYLTTATDNRIVRATLRDDTLGTPEVLVDGIPSGFIHDGGRMVFGPDGYLYASTGESGVPELAQDLGSLGGKILRITADGDPAPGNPDPDSPVWSYGHRNIQGLAFDDDERLWASEFGAADWDELNLIRPGKNYGWPLVEGRGDQPGLVDPQVVWRTTEASPSGLAWLDGRLWLAALRGERLWRVQVTGGRAADPADFFVGELGRIRTVVPAPDGRLWITTSNLDGRGEPGPDDDQILVVDPGRLG